MTLCAHDPLLSQEETKEQVPANAAAEPAAEEAPVAQAQVIGAGEDQVQRISLSLRNIDIIEALKFFAMKTGFNIVPTNKVAGRVTLSVERAPVVDVFDIMLRSNNLAYDKRGEIYNVMTEDEYRRLYGKLFSDMRRVGVFHLRYAIPEQAFTLLDTVKSSIGRLLVDAESGTIMLMDIPENIEQARKTLEALERETTVKVYNLQYAKAKDVEEQLRSQLDVKKVGTIRSDERTNSIIVQTLPERIKNIEMLIKSLDKKTRGVLIDTKIIKINLNDELDTGIEWEGLFRFASEMGMTYLGSYPFSLVQSATAAWQSRLQFLQGNMSGAVGAYPFSGTTSNLVGSKVAPGEKLHIGIIDKDRDFDVVIRYLQTFGKTKIVSNPTLAVVNNQEAKIHIGERRAYVTTTTTAGASTTTTSEEVTFVDIGVRLSVIPTINEDGYVTLKIKPEISSVIGEILTSSKNLVPIIDTSSVETTVIAKDGATIIIAGLGKEEKTETTTQVPLLGKIPFLGALFRTKTQGSDRMELLIMLTPIIFEGDSLVTAKDKEMELFGVKPMKKFDVFKPEEPLIAPSGTPELPKELFSPKLFEPYSQVEQKEEAQAVAALQDYQAGVDEKETLLPKGFKVYSAVPRERLSAAEPREVSVKQQEALTLPQLKEYRTYN